MKKFLQLIFVSFLFTALCMADAIYSYQKNQNARLYDSLCREITGL